MDWSDFSKELSTSLCRAGLHFFAIKKCEPSLRDNFTSTQFKFAALASSICSDVPDLMIEAHLGVHEGKAYSLVDVRNSIERGWVSTPYGIETAERAFSSQIDRAVLDIVRPLVTESQLTLRQLEHVKRSVTLPYGFNAQLITSTLSNSIGIFEDDGQEPLAVYWLKGNQVYESLPNQLNESTLRYFKRIPTHSFDEQQMDSLAPRDWSNLFALWISGRVFRTLDSLVRNPLIYRSYCKELWAAPKRLARKHISDYRSGLQGFGPSTQSVKVKLEKIKGDYAL